MEVFVARQPIFNSKEETIAYELLYRRNHQNEFPSINGDQATAEVLINSFLSIGIDKLSNGKPCFINFTQNLLMLKVPAYFRPREIVVEILEDVTPSKSILQICRELKSQGYQIALDDFILYENSEDHHELMRLADIIKVDFLNTSVEKRTEIEALAKLLNVKLLAEKVETMGEYHEAKKKGYSYFQGYFFSKPIILSSHDVPAYFHSYYSVIQNLSVSEPNIQIITNLIEQDVSLSYKLLRLINSPAYRPKQKISSIRQAIVLLGLIEIQKWIYVLAVREKNTLENKMSEEIIRTCLTRAKMCELIAGNKKEEKKSSMYFLTGMFSMLDAILSMPMEHIVKELPLMDIISDALKGKENDLKDVLDLVIAVEKAEWEKVFVLSGKINSDPAKLFEFYTFSCSWAEELLKDDLLLVP
ncbi:EAL and HDOD domain-containing protein [Falsibacillus pallidus]|uniref:EAL and modified HD-GYP domain-containing signal transduction protein n=1 Tax=Falsibacillus pallidus TaxID=493781 RepID=A0A370GID9_9BACI|nr:HDOD domain-containing protein [Falsibacillus pallidus]RDI43130.1 EAL and modified HD-GYP domain-containing signal transduction protein [Falsibacillus pallidus]